MQQSAATHDRRFDQGMVHLQAGEWEMAIENLAELAAQYPDNRRVQATLEEARLRAELDGAAHYGVWRLVERWRPFVFRALILLVVGVVTIYGARFFRDEIVPALDGLRADIRHESQLKDGWSFLEAGELDAADGAFNALLADLPDHPEALQGLELTTAERERRAQYEQALELIEQGDDAAARQLLVDIGSSAPGYRETERLIAEIGDRQGIDRLFAEAEEDFEAGRAVEAVSKYEQIRRLYRGYRRQDVEGRLVELYQTLGLELVDADPPAADALPRAIEHFRKALALKPTYPEAAEELQFALLFLESQALFHDGQWDDAIARLRPLYDQRPDYHNQSIAEMLYEAYWRSGDEHHGAGNSEYGNGQYQNAMALPVDDKELVRGRIDAYATPTPEPTATAEGQPRLVTGETQVGVRSGPGTNYPRIGALEPGSEMPVTGKYQGWYQFTFEGKVGWVSDAVVGITHDQNVPVITPGPTPRLPTPLPTPMPPTATPNPEQMRGLIVNAYFIPRAPGPFGQARDIWFNFSVTNTTNDTISYTALGTWVQETGQFRESWAHSLFGPGHTLVHRDHINIIQPGTYNLWLAIYFSDGGRELLSGPIRVIVQ